MAASLQEPSKATSGSLKQMMYSSSLAIWLFINVKEEIKKFYNRLKTKCFFYGNIIEFVSTFAVTMMIKKSRFFFSRKKFLVTENIPRFMVAVTGEL